MERKALVQRKTGETDITVEFNVDGKGMFEIETGIGFLDHMLSLFSKHGLFDLKVKAEGDLHVDAHHTVEDIGIVLGQAINKALGDRKSIKRYGTAFVPMDESLAMVSLDLGKRPYMVFNCEFDTDMAGGMETQLFKEFFNGVSFNSLSNIHVRVFYGNNDHHRIEAVFKAFGRALDQAAMLDGRIEGVMSTKGKL